MVYVLMGVVISAIALFFRAVQTHLLAVGLTLIIAALFRWFLETE